MKPSPLQVKEKFADLLRLNPENQKIYLVGGVVRDLVLRRENKDVDILCEHDSRIIARRWAEMKSGAFYILDKERNACRVITVDNGKKLTYDFASQQGETLIGDLLARDFTINAMAIDFDLPEELIDPLNGEEDLELGVLRACSATSFSSDPVRVLRAVRYHCAYGLQVESDTQNLQKTAVKALGGVSGERKRDEFFKILDLVDPFNALIELQEMEILPEIGLAGIPPINISRFLNLDHILGSNKKVIQVEEQSSFQLPENFRKYLPAYISLLGQKNSSERSGNQMLKLACILWGVDLETMRKIAHRLLLSNEECERLTAISQYSSIFLTWCNQPKAIDDRDLYLFFTKTGAVGLDIGVLNLANQLSKSLSEKNQSTIEKMNLLVGKLFECWFDRKSVVYPEPYLNGNELMINFDLSPGPFIGKLLDMLKEEQAAGTIKNRDQAMVWIEEQVNENSDQMRWNK
ncbi:MAG: hypothetical protein AB9897_02715 [Anaerolineaceae bacterium]